MPALTTLVLKDRKATPVDHTFVPNNVENGTGTVVESSGMKIGDSKFSLTSRKTANGRYRADLKLEVPVVENAVINGLNVPQVSRIAYATVNFSFSDKSTTAERNDIVGMLEDALKKAKTMVDKTVVDLEGVWG